MNDDINLAFNRTRACLERLLKQEHDKAAKKGKWYESNKSKFTGIFTYGNKIQWRVSVRSFRRFLKCHGESDLVELSIFYCEKSNRYEDARQLHNFIQRFMQEESRKK